MMKRREKERMKVNLGTKRMMHNKRKNTVEETMGRLKSTEGLEK